MYICIYVHMYMCICVTCIYVHMYMCIYVYVCICIYVYVYILCMCIWHIYMWVVQQPSIGELRLSVCTGSHYIFLSFHTGSGFFFKGDTHISMFSVHRFAFIFKPICTRTQIFLSVHKVRITFFSGAHLLRFWAIFSPGRRRSFSGHYK